MFEIIMLAGFMYAATSQWRPQKKHGSRHQESKEAVAPDKSEKPGTRRRGHARMRLAKNCAHAA